MRDGPPGFVDRRGLSLLRRINAVHPASAAAAINTLECFFHDEVCRRERTNRVRCCCITGEQESLAAAAAEVTRTAITATARFRHPVFVAEAAECRRLLPDPT